MTKLLSLHYGEILKTIFYTDGISVKEIAQKTGMTTQGVYNIFKTKTPRIDVILNLTKHLSAEAKLNALDLLMEGSESEFSREKIVEHFIAGQDKFNKDTENIRNEIYRQDHIYANRLNQIEGKIDLLAEQLKMMKDLVKAKDEMIDMLKKQLNKG